MAKHEDDLQSLIHDMYAIALINSESVTVGPLPIFMSKLAHFFVMHAGKIRCEITGSKDTLSDLGQGSSMVVEIIKTFLFVFFTRKFYKHKKHKE